jgi:hypothetical protein
MNRGGREMIEDENQKGKKEIRQEREGRNV